MMFTVNAQVDNEMNKDSIKISENITLFQKKDRVENQTSWKLCLQNKKDNKVILLDSHEVTHPDPNAIIASDNSILEIPKLLFAIKDEKNIYTFIFKEYALWLYQYSFTNDNKFESKRIKILKMLSGTVPNFGDAYFNIFHHKVSDEDYFNISHNRVIGKTEMLTRFNKNLFNLKKLVFSDKVIKIKDEEEIFKTLDLDKNIDKVSSEIKKFLIKNKIIDKINNFKYLGNIDLTSFKKYESRFMGGYIYFFYQENNLIKKIIRYNNYENEWLIGDYKEEEIKQP